MGSSTIHAPRYRLFCQMLRTWRIDSGQSQAGLAAKLRKPPSYVHKCEVAERKIDPLELFKWWEACDVDSLKAFRQLRDFAVGC
jgi:hypothetical protein